MPTLIIKDSIATYDAADHKLTERGTFWNDNIDHTTTTANAYTVTVSSLPRYFVMGQWGWDGKKLYPLPVFLPGILAQAKADKLAEINAACDDFLAVLTESYPAREVLTFDQQKAEADAVLADPSAPAPMLTPLAAARGLGVTELAMRVRVKTEAFTAIFGYVIGQRQRYEDTLDAAETLEDVAAIMPEYTMPEGM